MIDSFLPAIWPIYLPSPVSKRHELNLGLVSWHLALPGLTGGQFMYDLMQLSPATLKNMTSGAGTDGWTYATHLGGYGALLFSGTTRRCELKIASRPTAAVTFSAWVRTTSTSAAQQVVRGSNLASGSNFGFSAAINAVTAGKYLFGLITTTTTYIPEGGTVDTNWHWICGTYDGATMRFYVDGIQAFSAAATGTLVYDAGTLTLFGSSNQSSSIPLTGALDDVRIMNRAWSAAEVLRYYGLSRRGYPGLLNRISPLRFDSATSVISYESAANSGYVAANNTSTFNLNCPGSNRFAAVDVELLSVPGTTVTSVTCGGTAMTLIGAKTDDTGLVRVECWGLVNPTAGVNSVVVTLSASVAFAATAVAYSNVNQFLPTEGFASLSTSAGTASSILTVTSVADNDWGHGAIATTDGSITGAQTERNNVNGAAGSGANEDTGPKTPAGSITLRWNNLGALDVSAAGGYAIRPSSSSNPFMWQQLTFDPVPLREPFSAIPY